MATPNLPVAESYAATAWMVCALLVAVVLVRRPAPRGWSLSGAWLLASSPALIGQLGTLERVRAGGPREGTSAASATFASAIAPEAHGYVAASLACLALAWSLAGRPRARSSTGLGARPTWSNLVGAAAVVSCGVIGAAIGAPSMGLGVLVVLGLAAASLATPASSALAAWATALGWLGVRHWILFEEHLAALGGLDRGASVVRAHAEALLAVMVAGPGVVLAILGTGWLRGGVRAQPSWPSRLGGVVALALVGGGGSVTTRALAGLREGVEGGARPPRVERPVSAWSMDAAARCVAWRSGGGWQRSGRWPEGCGEPGPLAVAVDGGALAGEIGDPTWFGGSGRLEVLVRPVMSGEAAGTDEPAIDRGPLAALAWRAVPIDWVPDPLPQAFSTDRRVSAQLEGWLDRALGFGPSEVDEGGSVWIVDTPRGDMILMNLTGGGVTAQEPSARREVVLRLLSSSARPRLVLVTGARWTVQDALAHCEQAQLVGTPVSCVWVRGRPTGDEGT